MAYIPHTPADVAGMLEVIGVQSIDALFDEIPRELRAGVLDVPPAMCEMEVGRLLAERAASDGRPLNFIGAGAYEHHIPAPVWAITTRGEFYSAYTPYQAEASQGTLQLIYEYQSMICALTGMEVSNASMYDGASALAEACLMAVRANRTASSRRILVPRTVNPTYAHVAKSIAGQSGNRVRDGGFRPNRQGSRCSSRCSRMPGRTSPRWSCSSRIFSAASKRPISSPTGRISTRSC